MLLITFIFMFTIKVKFLERRSRSTSNMMHVFTLKCYLYCFFIIHSLTNITGDICNVSGNIWKRSMQRSYSTHHLISCHWKVSIITLYNSIKIIEPNVMQLLKEYLALILLPNYANLLIPCKETCGYFDRYPGPRTS